MILRGPYGNVKGHLIRASSPCGAELGDRGSRLWSCDHITAAVIIMAVTRLQGVSFRPLCSRRPRRLQKFCRCAHAQNHRREQTCSWSSRLLTAAASGCTLPEIGLFSTVTSNKCIVSLPADRALWFPKLTQVQQNRTSLAHDSHNSGPPRVVQLYAA